MDSCAHKYKCAIDVCVTTHQELHNEHNGEVGCKEAHAAILACHPHYRLPNESQVDESAVGVAECEAEKLGHQRVLVLRGGAVVLEVLSKEVKRGVARCDQRREVESGLQHEVFFLP